MSHFAVMVIGPDPEAQLAPYHEFECTGRADQYVVDVDITAKAREEYQRSTMLMYRGPDGTLHDAYDPKFFRDPTEEETERERIFGSCGTMKGGGWYISQDWKDGKGYRAKIAYAPPGFEEVREFEKDHKTFAEWALDYYSLKPVLDGDRVDRENEHKFGHILIRQTRFSGIDIPGVNGKFQQEVIAIIDRTNPNKHWDWYQLGGRFMGMLKLKTGRRGTLGEPGVFDNKAKPGTTDQCLKRDIDLDGMREEARTRANDTMDTIEKLVGGMSYFTWNECAKQVGEDPDKHEYEKTRELYWNQPYVKAIMSHRDYTFVSWRYIDAMAAGRDAYVQQQVDGILATFALVYNGQWHEKGSMGWWGAVANEQDQGAWNRKVNELFDSLPDDTLISIYDCHI